MEWKKPFALFAGSFGFFLSLFLYLYGGLYLTNPHVVQDCPRLGQGCVDVKNWHCNSFSMLMCTYLDDFKSFGYENVDAQAAIALTCLFYMSLNGLLIHGLIKPEVIYRYQLGNVLSTIALISTLVYVSYLMKLYITLSKMI